MKNRKEEFLHLTEEYHKSWNASLIAEKYYTPQMTAYGSESKTNT